MHNIILIVTDTYRYDNLKQRAARPVATPYIDSFAETRAVEVDRMYTGSFPTIPHRTDMATGRLGWPNYGWQPITRSSENHVAGILGAQGYATQLICDCPHLFKNGFPAAFDAAYQNRGQEGDRPLLHLNDPITRVMPADKTRRSPTFRGYSLVDTHRWTNHYPTHEADTFPAKTGELTVRWLEDNASAGPFFLWVDLFDPHEPWDAPEYLVRKYDAEYDGEPMIHPNYGPSSEYDQRELHNLWAHYAAESELVDRWIGRILEKITDLGLWGDSVVVVTTDHGMSIGEHGRTGKSNIHPEDPRFWPIYPEIGHIPFLIAAPGLAGGRSANGFMQPIDILPTVCELSGASLEETPETVDGVSQVPMLSGVGTATGRDYVCSGCFLRLDPASTPAPPAGATTPFLVTERWGYAPVGAEGRPELYETGSDPLAEHDVSAEHPEVLAELHELFVEHLRSNRAPESLVELFSSEGAGSGSWAIDYS